MRLLVAALVLTFAVAVTASVFAIWPVVADAPWEQAAAAQPIVVRQPTPSRCEVLSQLLAQAQTEIAARRFNALLEGNNCPHR
jgi:hypothetical protein